VQALLEESTLIKVENALYERISIIDQNNFMIQIKTIHNELVYTSGRLIRSIEKGEKL
jgi:hypothetical protein